jgi:long-chain fatty acid transport protein
MRLLTRIVFLVLFPVLANAGISDNPLLGIKASSMAGTVTGIGLDGSAAFYNPATMSFLKKNYLNVGFNYNSPQTVFLMNTGDKYNSSKSGLFPISLYGVYKFNDKINLGLAINNPFQNNISWNSSWAGKYICISNKSNVQNIQPTISYRLNDKFSVGGGLMFTFYRHQASKALNYENAAGDVVMNYDLKGSSLGLNFGLNYNDKKWHLGFAYRSALNYKNAKGEVNLENAPPSLIANGVLPSSNTEVTANIKMPSVVSLGAAYELDQNWLVTMDINIYNWTNIDSLNLEVDNYGQYNFNVNQDITSSYAIRFGARYNYSRKLIFRGGFAFNLSPVLNTYVHPAYPEYNKFTYTGGASYQLKKSLSVDAFVGYSDIKERREIKNINNFNGTYKANAFIGGIGLNYEF